MKTVYAVIRVHQSAESAHGVYATERLAHALVEALEIGRVPNEYHGPARVKPMTVEDGYSAATYASLMDRNLNCLIIDPDGQYPWPDKLTSDGWRMAAA